ncbi:hypothetical protein EMPS_06802 [Entomortierella parvispora]|uniref:FAD-binding domain-containing protein n=1 Tax=Entomortierella parvispora TaxID=205924 RepID=A0A9P3HD39_9FUNG|nr:hypothetical protein EMPS_06802 [Entomortierella parvispora]
MTARSGDEQVQLKVIIVGAGIGGLLLAILLEKIGLDYDIFERSKEVRPLGSIMSIGPNILPVIEQLGLLDDLLKFSFPVPTLNIYNEDMSHVGTTSFEAFKERGGYDFLAFSRPDFHHLLLSQIPSHKLHLGKKVLSLLQGDRGAMIRTSDGKTHEGDIVVGADGAHSAIRQCLYDRLAEENKLPRSDSTNLDLGYNCMVGVATGLDSEIYPGLKDGHAHFCTTVAYNVPHSWRIFMVPGNRICWSVSVQITLNEGKTQAMRNSEWGPEAIEDMVKLVAHHKVPVGGTLGDLIEATPKDLISKVVLEEKMFETWYHDRTVLLGDACHKMMPSAGQGACNAMQDAVILANCLFDLQSGSIEDITAAFKSYKNQRYPQASAQFKISQQVGKIFYGHSFTERMIRYAILNWAPKSLESGNFVKAYSYRPQAVFLPQVEDRGLFKALPQHESRRMKACEEAAKSQRQPQPL